MSKLFVDEIVHQSSQGSGTITIGASGETINVVGTLQNNGSALISGITEADYYYTNSNISLSAATKTLVTTWARNTQGFKIGTGMSVSSGIWTFPSTGIYLINVNINYNASTSSRYVYSEIQSTTDNSTYTTLTRGYTQMYHASSSWWAGNSISIIFDCTNTTNDKIKILGQSENATTIEGGVNDGSQAVFVKIGDT
jgi:hypothetical protein